MSCVRRIFVPKGWQVDEEWFEFGFLRKVAKVAGMLTNEEEVKSMLAAVDVEDSKMEATHHGALCAAQRLFLRSTMPSTLTLLLYTSAWRPLLRSNNTSRTSSAFDSLCNSMKMKLRNRTHFHDEVQHFQD